MKFEISRDEYVSGGNVGCPRCGAVLGMRHVLKIMGKRTIVVMPACCWGIIAGPFSFDISEGSALAGSL